MTLTSEIKEVSSAKASLPGILFVEDENNDVTIARHKLKKNKLRNSLHAVATVAEMFDYLHGTGPYHDRADSPMPAVIVLDLRLPDMHGLRAQAMLRASLKFRHIPIILISSQEQWTALNAGVNLGANAYMIKPFELADFKHIVALLGLPIEFAGD